jgi:hypothetical protein
MSEEKNETTEARIRRRLVEVEQAALADDAPREVTPDWGASIATVARVLAEELERLRAEMLRRDAVLLRQIDRGDYASARHIHHLQNARHTRGPVEPE